MANRMMLLVNPNAGKGGFNNVLANILHTICDGGWLPTVVFTRYAGEAPGIVTRHACEYDMVTCLGGDGTLSEVAAGMMRLRENLRRPIGYIPLGTTNDVARTLGLSFKPTEAAKSLLTGSPVPYDIGKFGFDSYFTYVAAFGAFTEVSYGTPQETKQALGQLAYMLEGIRSLADIRPVHMKIDADGQVYEDDFIFGSVCNSTSLGGVLKLEDSQVDMNDGRFEALFIPFPPDLIVLNRILNALRTHHYEDESLHFLRASSFTFEGSPDVTWTLDGEAADGAARVEIRNIHNAIRLIH